MIIKATTAEKQHRAQAEVDNYRRLGSLQGQHIPVCLGVFKARIAYWYHGELMDQDDGLKLVWDASPACHQ